MKLTKHLPLLIIFLAALFLRFYHLGDFPPLYSDEASYGYNAYSILTTGRDEWGKFLPLTIQSFGDYKPPMTAYLMIPSIAVFGLNEFAVRFPTTLLSTLTVLLIYFLAKEVLDSRPIALIAAALLAISPWHIHFSRMSMLVGLENFFLTLGVLSFIKFTRRPPWLFVSTASFALAIYSYYGSRVTVPLLVLALSILFYRQLLAQKRTVLLAGLIGFLLLSPLLLAMWRDPQTLIGRAKYMSVFYNDSIRSRLWKTSVWHGAQNSPVIFTRIFDNKVYFYLRDITRRYFSHLSFSFWALDGDVQPPFNLPNMGQFYLVDILFVFVGFYYAVKGKSRVVWAILLFLFISPITSSLTFITPAANRSFNMVIGWTVLTAFGIYKLRRFWLVTCVLYLVALTSFLYQYTYVLPYTAAAQFYYGIKQTIAKISQLEPQYSKIVLTGNGGPLYIYSLFYNRYPPADFINSKSVNPETDNLGWQHIDSFGKYVIPRNMDWNKYYKEIGPLYVGFQEEIPDACPNPKFVRRTTTALYWYPVIDAKIYYPNGTVAYKLVHLQEIYDPTP
jgi:4-amino-4-deoxy-L-arabinose transferase-like glycosyltransferase